jgi:RNA polymerase sigma factor (TIGR02999 family)
MAGGVEHPLKAPAPGGLTPEVIEACYGDMRRIAGRIIAGDGAGHLSQATELVNDAVIRLIRTPDLAVASPAHLMALAAQTMRRVLIDEARKAAAAKRVAPDYRTAWPDQEHKRLVTMEELDSALTALATVSPDHARIVELRFMMGLTVDETASATGLASRTVKRRWQGARAWLFDYLNGAAVSALA